MTVTPTPESPLQRMVRTTPTEFWNDGPNCAELQAAMDQGAVGATSNPFLIHEEMSRDKGTWKARARELRAEHPAWSITEIAWTLYGEIARRAADTLRPVYDREGGREGYVSVQVDPTQYANAEAMVEQALVFSRIAPNIRVKLPVTKAGITAMEEATAQGVTVTSTVSFSVPQAIAVAEAMERGLRRRAAASGDAKPLWPISTIMIGRLDDWLRAQAERDGIIVDPGILDWAGVAVMKKAYRIYRERGYRPRLLAAAYRNHYHWSQLIGGELSLTIPFVWQRRFNASSIEVRPRIDDPVDPAIVEALSAAFVDFRRAYAEDGLAVEEFDAFPPTVRTLRAFTKSYYDMLALVTDFLLPNPDTAAAP
jgi:transaldolase